MDQLFAIELNGSWKAEKMSVCHFKQLGVALVLQKAMCSVCSNHTTNCTHVCTHCPPDKTVMT